MEPDETLKNLDWQYPLDLPEEEKANWEALKEHYADDPAMLRKMELALLKLTEMVRALREGRDPETAWVDD